MMDLFSSFNPMTSMNLSLNWTMLMIPNMMILIPYWKINSLSLLSNKLFMKISMGQFKPSMNKIMYPNMPLIMSIMFMILTMNCTSLLPNTFSPTSHIMINISMALIMWMSLTINKMNKPMKILSHLTPMNTPNLLIPFMVIIELTSMLIQPLTLSIRLTANIMAGHIMMILISQMYNIIILPTLTMNLTMMILEMSVSMIQAYVFSMLIIMYSK